MNVAAVFNGRLPGPFPTNSTARVLRWMPLLDTLVLAAEHPNHRFRDAFPADLSVIPGATDAEVSMAGPKALHLAYSDASPAPADPFNQKIIALRFRRTSRQLKAGTYRYLKRLVVDTSPQFPIYDSERALKGFRTHFQLVGVEGIEMPNMPLPPCCVYLDSCPRRGRYADEPPHAKE